MFFTPGLRPSRIQSLWTWNWQLKNGRRNTKKRKRKIRLWRMLSSIWRWSWTDGEMVRKNEGKEEVWGRALFPPWLLMSWNTWERVADGGAWSRLSASYVNKQMFSLALIPAPTLSLDWHTFLVWASDCLQGCLNLLPFRCASIHYCSSFSCSHSWGVEGGVCDFGALIAFD